MNIQKYFAIACTINLLTTYAQAAAPQVDLDEAVAQVSADSTLISQWINDQMKDAAAFNSTSGGVVPAQLKLFGFEVGAEAVVSSSKVDVVGLHNLGTTIINTAAIDAMTHLPFPSVLGHAKIGLPWGLDAGVRLGGIPSVSSNNGSNHTEISNSIFGLDLRKKLIDEGITRPFGLTLGLGYTHAKGHITASTPYHANSSFMVNGNPYTGTLDAVGTERTDWKTDSVGLQLIMNKKIAFINPYIGASANHNYGTIESSINNVGTITLDDGGGASAPQSLTAGGGVSGRPNNWDNRGLAGIEITIFPFLKLGIQGEVANEGRYAGSIGLRGQFH